MIQLYVAKIEYLTEKEQEEKVAYSILPAGSYQDAVTVILDEWGENNVIGFELHCVADDPECASITISPTMANAFIHDIPEDVYCCESDYLRKQKEKEYGINLNK